MDMSTNLETITRIRKKANFKFKELDSKVYAKFIELEAATFKDGEVSKKNKELIALGISVVINCESCMQWHIEQAAEAGATLREVLEAVEVGIEMGGGPATVSARFALQVMADVYEEFKF